MEEQLAKTAHDLTFALESLREALHVCGNVESIIILELIGKTAETRRAVENLLTAHQADKRKDAP